MDKHLFNLACGSGTPLAAVQTALVVGTILTAINQGDLIISGAPVVWWRICLTYCVPFIVHTRGAVNGKLSHARTLEAKTVCLDADDQQKRVLSALEAGDQLQPASTSGQLERGGAPPLGTSMDDPSAARPPPLKMPARLAPTRSSRRFTTVDQS